MGMIDLLPFYIHTYMHAYIHTYKKQRNPEGSRRLKVPDFKAVGT